MDNKFKIGDLVYYKRNYGTYVDTIPCEVVTVNKNTVNLTDGYDVYKNIRPSSLEKQSELPSNINK
mgnify:CR=1 FL=1